jgi:hypothetical protein
MKTRKTRSAIPRRRKTGPPDTKVRAFLEAYLRSVTTGVRGNATQAAIEAGYAMTSAAAIGSNLLKRNKTVKAALAQLVAQQAVTKTQVLKEIGLIAFSTLADVLTWTQVLPEGAPESEAIWKLALKPGALAHPALESVEVWTDAKGNERLKAKLHSKLGALELYARYFRLLQDPLGSTIEQFIVNIHTPPGLEVKVTTLDFHGSRASEKARPVQSLSRATTVPGG